DPRGSVRADANVQRLAVQGGPCVAGPAEDRVGVIEHPRIALAVDIDAHGTAGNLVPAAAVPAGDGVAAGYPLSAHVPDAAGARAAGADVDGRSRQCGPLAGNRRRGAARCAAWRGGTGHA